MVPGIVQVVEILVGWGVVVEQLVEVERQVEVESGSSFAEYLGRGW